MNKERQARAANELEEMTMFLKEFIRLLRQGQSDSFAYAMVYYARHRLGKTVRELGAGAPDSAKLNQVEVIADAESWRPKPD